MKTVCVCTSVNARVNCAVTKKQSATMIRLMHSSCAQETLLNPTPPAHSARYQLRSNPTRSAASAHQECLPLLRHNSFLLVHPCIPLHRTVRIGWLTWTEVSEDVYGLAGVVLYFQILQIQQLAVVNDPSTRFKIIIPQACTNKEKLH